MITGGNVRPEQLQAAMDLAPLAMVLVDADGQIRFVNQACERMLGFDEEELLGKPIDVLWAEPSRGEPANEARQVLLDPKRHEASLRELVACRRDRVELPVEVSFTPAATSAGDLTLVSLRDATSQADADAMFRALVDAAPSAMIVVRHDGRIAFVNQRTMALFGYGRDDLIGSPIELLIPERYRREHPALVSGYMSRPVARPLGAGRELWGRRRDGSEVPVEIGLTPIPTSRGELILASVIDVSERHRAEAVRERLAAIVEGSEDAILSKTLDGTITTWNGAAERLFGYSAAEAIGQSIALIVPESMRDEEAGLMERIRQRERVQQFETKRRRRDGILVDVSITLSPLGNGSGEIVGASSIVRDVSALKLSNAELARSNAELARSNAELEQFAYVASHDLQEPLRMVANYTELLRKNYGTRLDERADKYIHYASDGARRMQTLVNDLLAYSRVGSQGKPMVSVAAGAVLGRAIASLGASINESGAVIEVGELPSVCADEVQLQQLFQNLLSNAIKFRAADPPRIVISAKPAGEKVEFSVADNGIGIDMRFVGRIFQMFQRLHERDKYAGSGIGLALAKRIVERHGGNIWVESALGVGSTFYFTLASASAGKGGLPCSH
ncbi:MAG TPA: PAS domain S-box protein [Polyangiaceae bacterium]|nr:PAS domain S-box protein [Polyangiaceae bacterium]